MGERRFDSDFVRDCLSILRTKTDGRMVHRRRFLGALDRKSVV